MATYTVPSGTFSYAQTLASTADTVTFADRAGYVSVQNLGTSPVWVRVDGPAATVDGQNCYAVQPGRTGVFANGLPLWYPSSRVLLQGVNQYGGGNTVTDATHPGEVQAQRSLAGQAVNPGTQVSLISTGADAYVVAFAG